MKKNKKTSYVLFFLPLLSFFWLVAFSLGFSSAFVLLLFFFVFLIYIQSLKGPKSIYFKKLLLLLVKIISTFSRTRYNKIQSVKRFT